MMKRLLVLGAGTMVVNKLRPKLDRSDWTITVVDQDDEHLYQPGLLLLPFGAYRRDELLKPRLHFIPSGVELVAGTTIPASANRILVVGQAPAAQVGCSGSGAVLMANLRSVSRVEWPTIYPARYLCLYPRGYYTRDMDMALTTTTSLAFDEAVAQIRLTLAEEGFGILTEIDVRATMKAKLDIDVEPYLILGACNPSLAHQALTLEPAIGLLLPCNVTVRTEGGATIVQAMDPQLLVTVVDKPGLKAVADEAGSRLAKALVRLPKAVPA